QCPASDVRIILQHALLRTSEAKGRWQLYESSVALDLMFRPRTRCKTGRNVKSATLAARLGWKRLADSNPGGMNESPHRAPPRRLGRAWRAGARTRSIRLRPAEARAQGYRRASARLSDGRGGARHGQEARGGDRRPPQHPDVSVDAA